MKTRKPSMRFTHKPGEVLQVDFAGAKLSYVEKKTGEVIECLVIVGVLPFSGYSYVRALPNATLPEVVNALNLMLDFFGGIPLNALSDNMKQWVTRTCKYEPTLPNMLEQWALHNHIGILATRPVKPKDKPSVENQVLITYRRVYALLRNTTFYSLEELNKGILEKLQAHHRKNFQKKTYSRIELFNAEEKPVLQPLPDSPYKLRHYTKGKVYPNYYVVIGEDWHFYSVPSQYIGKEVRIVYDSDLVEIYYNHERIAFHRRSYKEHGYTTRMEHIAALAKIREWYPIWVDQCIKMPNDPWTSEILTRKEVELISLAVNAACTTLSAEGTRHHIRAALEAGATRAEIMMIIKIATFLSIHTASLGAPILLEEAKAAGIKQKQKNPASTPVCDKMKAAGQWNTGWDAFFEIDPAWTEAIIAASLPVYTSGIYTPRLAELLSIAVDASITHMYAPGTRRHIQSALQLGVTIEEIMEVLKICVSQGIQASNLGFPILAEELERVTTKEKDIASNRTAGVS